MHKFVTLLLPCSRLQFFKVNFLLYVKKGFDRRFSSLGYVHCPLMAKQLNLRLQGAPPPHPGRLRRKNEAGGGPRPPLGLRPKPRCGLRPQTPGWTPPQSPLGALPPEPRFDPSVHLYIPLYFQEGLEAERQRGVWGEAPSSVGNSTIQCYVHLSLKLSILPFFE